MPAQAYDERQNQMTMDSYLSFSQRFAKFKSKRLQKAVTGITGVHDPELNLGDLSEPSKKAGAKGKGRKPGPAAIAEEPAEEVRPCYLLDCTGGSFWVLFTPFKLHFTTCLVSSGFVEALTASSRNCSGNVQTFRVL